MVNVTDKQIFEALREHVKPATLTQLLVDITNEAMEDAEAREMVITSLGLTPKDKKPVTRPYNLTEFTAKKVYPEFNLKAIPLLLKYAPLYGVITKKQFCAFVATMIVESNGFNAKRENFNYRPERLLKVFPKSRIPDLKFARALVAQGQPAIANHLYNGRYGNRIGSNDGWNYRGGGPIQLTFLDNYRAAENRLGIPLVANPKLIEELDTGVLTAFDFWRHKRVNELADGINVYSNGYTLNTLNNRGVETKNYRMNTGIVNVRKRVNGGDNGLEEFAEYFELCMQWF